MQFEFYRILFQFNKVFNEISWKFLNFFSQVPGSEQGAMGSLRTKLINLLQNSLIYSESLVLSQIVNTALYEETLILYKRVERNF